MGLPEFVHQLHCVNMLWKHTYPEYFQEEYNYSKSHAEEWRHHMDHCVETLRQKLMCDADVSIITYNWVKGEEAPKANVIIPTSIRA